MYILFFMDLNISYEKLDENIDERVELKLNRKEGETLKVKDEYKPEND